jgi:hypothetical protein
MLCILFVDTGALHDTLSEMGQYRFWTVVSRI